MKGPRERAGTAAERVREGRARFRFESTEGVRLNPKCSWPSPGRTGDRWPGTTLKLSVCRCRVGAVPVTCSSRHALPALRCLSSSPCLAGSPYCSPSHQRSHSRHLPFPAVTVGWTVPEPPAWRAGPGLSSVGTSAQSSQAEQAGSLCCRPPARLRPGRAGLVAEGEGSPPCCVHPCRATSRVSGSGQRGAF